MAAFIGEFDITKPISDYGKMLKYQEKFWENDISVDLNCIQISTDLNFAVNLTAFY